MHSLGRHFEEVILKATGTSQLEITEVIQELWSGYGKILRVELDGERSVIVKHVRFPTAAHHPRGWNSNLSHERKVRSYEVESAWYRDWSDRCQCRIPEFIAYEKQGDEVLILLEDLNAAGFPQRHSKIGWRQVEICLTWLAQFHATFIGAEPSGLWETGSYWHLETRPDELDTLDDIPLKNAACAIDQLLSTSRYQTLVHGDAKLANFCFSADSEKVAAVDFQYVGGGCGMKDVAYFVGSCLDEKACEELENQILDTYFAALRNFVNPETDADALVSEWKSLYPVAWTDFHRFLKGWSPGHWKINSYSERLAKEVIANLSPSKRNS